MAAWGRSWSLDESDGHGRTTSSGAVRLTDDGDDVGFPDLVDEVTLVFWSS